MLKCPWTSLFQAKVGWDLVMVGYTDSRECPSMPKIVNSLNEDFNVSGFPHSNPRGM